MADSTVTPTLARMLSDMERRLRALEGSPQLGSSSIKGGSLRILRADGTPVASIGAVDANTVGTQLYAADGSVLAAFGQVPALSGADGVQLGPTAQPTLLWNATDGMLRPHQISVFSLNAGAYGTTSGSFGLAADCYFERAAARYFHFRTVIGIDAGCTGEFRMTCSSGDTSNVISVASVGGAIYDLQLSWAPPALTLNSAARFELQSRRTAGAGTIYVYNPYGGELGDFRTTATSGGAWTATVL